MFELIFSDKRDAEAFYLHTQLVFKSFVMRKNQLIDNKEHYVISVSVFNETMLTKICEAFYLFILNYKLDHWMAKKIRTEFYFEDELEIEQITDIAFEIIDGKRKELRSFIDNPFTKEDLEFVVSNMLQDSIVFSFDSFVQFRLKKLFEQLDHFVEVAIDEYKMEQEYQMFIHMLRDFIDGREPLIESIHLKVEEDIIIFDDYMYEIKRQDLAKLIDKKLILQHPIYIDSNCIAPLLSIAPTKIYLYCDESNHNLAQTISNIFQERVKFRGLKDFFVQQKWFRQKYNEKI